MRYLARYTHRVAITDRRVLDVNERGVVFAYRDYRRGREHRTMTLSGDEWLRRFVDHVLPRGFTRLRSYGFLANARKKDKLAVIRFLIGAPLVEEPSASSTAPCACPTCGAGVLIGYRPTEIRRARTHDTS